LPPSKRREHTGTRASSPWCHHHPMCLWTDLPPSWSAAAREIPRWERHCTGPHAQARGTVVFLLEAQSTFSFSSLDLICEQYRMDRCHRRRGRWQQCSAGLPLLLRHRCWRGKGAAQWATRGSGAGVGAGRERHGWQARQRAQLRSVVFAVGAPGFGSASFVDKGEVREWHGWWRGCTGDERM
jgi:hypothetical protein